MNKYQLVFANVNAPKLFEVFAFGDEDLISTINLNCATLQHILMSFKKVEEI